MSEGRNAVGWLFSAGDLGSVRYPSQELLVRAIRRGDESAIYEMFVLYAPLLRDQARRMGVPPADLPQFVDTLMTDVALHLAEMDVAPRELTGYLVTALRNRVRTRHRDQNRHRVLHERAYTESDASSERVVAECHSEYGLRSTAAADAEREITVRPVIARLAEAAAKELSPEELVMLVGIGRHVPLRDIAAQLGLSYGAARVRLSRLRERFVKVVIEYARSLDAADRREIARFFRRANVDIEVRDGTKTITTTGTNGECEP